MPKYSIVKREPLLIALIAFFLILIFISLPSLWLSLRSYPYQTLLAIISLMMITTAIKESGYLSQIAKRLIIRIRNERYLAIFLLSLSSLLASFLTNDIALFIVIPLTLEIQRRVKKDLEKLVILEAIAVNVGSSLTPIGNPQNLYLWHVQHITFLQFVIQMLLPALLSFILLLIFALILFPKRKVEIIEGYEKTRDKKIFIISLSILIAFIVMALAIF